MQREITRLRWSVKPLVVPVNCKWCWVTALILCTILLLTLAKHFAYKATGERLFFPCFFSRWSNIAAGLWRRGLGCDWKILSCSPSCCRKGADDISILLGCQTAPWGEPCAPLAGSPCRAKLEVVEPMLYGLCARVPQCQGCRLWDKVRSLE